MTMTASRSERLTTHTSIYNPHTGAFLGQLTDTAGQVIQIEGLWGLAAGPETPTLYFTAGPGDESHGLLGALAGPAKK
jgi:hypothetical protein